MKYLLIIAALFLTGCYDNDKCPDRTFREYKYQDRVEVISGFYKGQTGKILSGAWTHEENCSFPSFKIKLDSTNEEIKTSQYDLKIIDSKELNRE